MNSSTRFRITAVRILGAAVCAALLASPGVTGAATGLTDDDIAAAVKTELTMDPAVMFEAIEVEAESGVVTLAGEVDNVTARKRAERIATTVRGVRSVVNMIAVVPGTTKGPAALTRDVSDALLTDPATDSYELDVSADGDGAVTLSGRVDSWTERDLAERVAGSVGGVTAVKNEIIVRYDDTRTDPEIRNDVEERLKWDAHIDATDIDVNVEDGAVTLSGTVISAAERNRAIRMAWVVGATEIDAGGLEVSSRIDRKWKRARRPFIADDGEVERAVEAAMVYDPRVDPLSVRVEVDQGVATLTGEVDNLRARTAARDDAMNTVGVVRVDNEIRVLTSLELADREVEQAVEAALDRDAFLEDDDVDVDVRTGNARLSGTVDTFFEKGEAEDVASRVLGVTFVTNDLHVETTDNVFLYDPYVDDWHPHHRWYSYQPRDPGRTDAAIKDSIENQLWWSPFVDSDAIDVSVHQGIATLTGTVGDWSERQAAENNAFDGGAIWVRNEIEIASK